MRLGWPGELISQCPNDRIMKTTREPLEVLRKSTAPISESAANEAGIVEKS